MLSERVNYDPAQLDKTRLISELLCRWAPLFHCGDWHTNVLILVSKLQHEYKETQALLRQLR